MYNIYIFTSWLFNNYKQKNKTQQESQITLFVTKESALLAMETMLHLGEDSWQGFTQIIPYPAGVTFPKLGNFTQAW